MNGIKTGLGMTPGEHIISADSALSRNIRQCFCLSCRGRLILQTDAQGAWFEHDLHALSAQQKAACVVLNPEKSHPYIEDMAMFLSPLPFMALNSTHVSSSSSSGSGAINAPPLFRVYRFQIPPQ